MSGGSLEYAYQRVDDAIESIEAGASKPMHHAFAKHLRLVSKALHDLEWVWSGDTSPGAEDAAIMKVVGAHDVLDAALTVAEKARDDLDAAIKAAWEAK